VSFVSPSIRTAVASSVSYSLEFKPCRLPITDDKMTSRFSLIDDRLRDLSDIPFGGVKFLICSRLLDVQPKISYARGRFHGKDRHSGQIQINGTLKMALRETMHKHEQLAGRVRRVGPGYSVSTDSLKPKTAFSCGGTYW